MSAAWGNRKKCSGVMCDREMPLKLKGRYAEQCKVSIDVWGRDTVSRRKIRSETNV